MSEYTDEEYVTYLEAQKLKHQARKLQSKIDKARGERERAARNHAMSAVERKQKARTEFRRGVENLREDIIKTANLYGAAANRSNVQASFDGDEITLYVYFSRLVQ